MIDHFENPDAAGNLLERRWFSSINAVRAAQAECEVLHEVMVLADLAWRRARAQLAELDNLRDALGDQLTYGEAECRPHSTVRHGTVATPYWD